MEDEVVTLATLCQGAVLERFQDALGEVLENIADPNTPAEMKRKIVLEVAIEPAEDRRVGNVSINIKKTLAGPKPVGARLWFARHQGQYVAVEDDPEQMKLRLDKPGAIVPHPSASAGERSE